MEKDAKERQREGGKIAGRGRPKADEKVPVNLPEPIDPHARESREQAAALLNVSGSLVSRAKREARLHGPSDFPLDLRYTMRII